MSTIIAKTIQEAIQDEIHDGFVKNSCAFSAYDVTIAIRMKVNADEISIVGYPMEDVNGLTTQRIEHHDVRDIVHDICGHNGISGYERKWDKTGGVGHFSWVPQATVSNASYDKVSATVAIISTQSQASAPRTSTDINDKTVIDMVTSYFDNRFNDGKPATIHSTQNRMKRRPLTQSQIRDIAEKHGYDVHNAGGSLSNAIVTPRTQRAFSRSITN